MTLRSQHPPTNGTSALSSSSGHQPALSSNQTTSNKYHLHEIIDRRTTLRSQHPQTNGSLALSSSSWLSNLIVGSCLNAISSICSSNFEGCWRCRGCGRCVELPRAEIAMMRLACALGEESLASILIVILKLDPRGCGLAGYEIRDQITAVDGHPVAAPAAGVA